MAAREPVISPALFGTRQLVVTYTLEVLIGMLESALFFVPAALVAAQHLSYALAGIVAAVRVNPLETEGRADLAAVMRGRPDIVIMSKVAEPAQVAALDEEVKRLEQRFDILPGATELVPNIESARGIMQTYAIAKASQQPSQKPCTRDGTSMKRSSAYAHVTPMAMPAIAATS